VFGFIIGYVCSTAKQYLSARRFNDGCFVCVRLLSVGSVGDFNHPDSLIIVMALSQKKQHFDYVSGLYETNREVLKITE